MVSNNPFVRDVWIAAAVAVACTLLGGIFFQPDFGFAPKNASWLVIMLALPYAMGAHLDLPTPWLHGFAISAYFLISLVFLWTRSFLRR